MPTTEYPDNVWVAQAWANGTVVERIVHVQRIDAMHDLAVCMDVPDANPLDGNQWTKVADDEWTYETDGLTLTVDRYTLHTGHSVVAD